jgi:DNA polymerase I-like protein with 3'-5' exonuclease and polymerase domains
MGRHLVYDLELKMKYKELRKDLHILEQVDNEILSLCIVDVDSRQRWSCTDYGEGYTSIQDGLDLLTNADRIIAHNGCGFDELAAKIVYPLWGFKGESVDTLIMSQLLFPNLHTLDYKRPHVPKELTGSHGLKAWGIRLTSFKTDYQGDFLEWSKEMQDYCEQDVEVTLALYSHLFAMNYSMDAIIMEGRFLNIITQQTVNGVHFDKDAALKLYDEIEEEMAPLLKEIKANIPDWVERSEFTPKVNNSTRGYVKDETIIREVITPFNPNSRPQIVKYFKETYSWKPTVFTQDKKTKQFTTNPKIDADIMDGLPYPEAEYLSKFLVKKALMSKLKDAKGGWTNIVRESGKIHGKMNTLGTRTRRCTHSSPNISQVPAPGKYKGEECRKLFVAPPGYKIVGADMSGIQLRMFAHYLYPYDNGAYAREILEGDIHTANQKAAGLPTRPLAKTFIYAFLFGGGDGVLGKGLHPKGSEQIRKSAGSKLRRSFLAKTPAIGLLLGDIKIVHRTRKKMKLMDGGSVPSPSEHTALNTLLQGSDSVCCKTWVVLSHKLLEERGLSQHVAPIIQSHDEQELLVKEEYAVEVGELLKEAATLTGELLETRIRLDAEYRIGDNWYDVH